MQIFLIYIFNNTTINIPSDFVFLCLCIPGYDLLRLAIHRIFNKKHPFKADKNHIHHMMIKKIGYQGEAGANSHIACNIYDNNGDNYTVGV